MSTSLKIVSLNVEHSRHLDTVLPFLEREQPDVTTIQELNPSDAQLYMHALRAAEPFFVFMGRELRDGVVTDSGLGIFSRFPMSNKISRYYKGTPEQSLQSDFRNLETNNNYNRAIAMCDIEKKGSIFSIATTHFTWTQVGNQADDAQRTDLEKMFEVLDTLGTLVLTGDFNAARGSEIFDAIAQKYKDNIPPECTTTIDKQFHRAGELPYVVDGLFSTPEYTVSDVKVVGGVSDHMAVIGTISKS